MNGNHLDQALEQRDEVIYFRWAVCFLVLGLTWRTVRYLLAFPLWGDEAFAAMNVLDRDYRSLMRPLEYYQTLPVGFMWLARGVTEWFGVSERPLRLIAYLAGMGSLIVFWRITEIIRRSLPQVPPWSSLFALGIFAVSYYPVRHGNELKPYALDLFLATLLLWLVVGWLAQQTGVSSTKAALGSPSAPVRSYSAAEVLVIMALLVGPATWFSYPLVLVAGGVGLALLPTILRERSWRTTTTYGLYGILLIAGFSSVFYFVARAQYKAGGGGVDVLWNDWKGAFPPFDHLGALLYWLIDIHTGRMLAYPIGGRDFGSVATFLLCAVGGWTLWKLREIPAAARAGKAYPLHRLTPRILFALLLWPFVLAFGAAILRLYPYGTSARTSLYLAPAICLLAGLGIGRLVDRVLSPVARRRWVAGICTGLTFIGLAGIGRDVWRPYKTWADEMNRAVIYDTIGRTAPEDQIVCLNSVPDLTPFGGYGARFRWYLRLATGDRAGWGGKVDWDRLEDDARLWAVRYWRGERQPEDEPWTRWEDEVAPKLVLVGEESCCYDSNCTEGIELRVYEHSKRQE